MDPIQRNFYNNGFQSLPPITSQHHPVINPSPSHSSSTSFPILAIALLGILATAILLVSYYVFVIKCCLNWHRIDILRRFSTSRARRHEDPLMVYSPAMENRGLDELAIREIPVLHFKRGIEEERRSLYECAVCLNEFQEDEKLRVIPSCSHGFHIDCIDVWLQNNANCPLCRSSISTPTRFPFDQIIAPSSSPQDPGSFIGGDEDFVVIELREEEGDQSISSHREEERNSGELSVQSVSPIPKKLEQKLKKGRKLHQVSSMGDECIDIRGKKDEQFLIQPIRRSISMDSSADRQLYLAVQEIIQQNTHFNEISNGEACSSRVRRSFFSFGHGRGSRSTVLPIEFEP